MFMKALLRTFLLMSLLWLIALAVQHWPAEKPAAIEAAPPLKVANGRPDFDIHDRLRPVEFE